jgi:hypothetical protein
MNHFRVPDQTIHVNTSYHRLPGGTTSDCRIAMGTPLVRENGRLTRVAVTSATIPLASYVAPGNANINGPREIHIRSPNFNTNVYETRVQADSTILAIIPVTGPPFSNLTYASALPTIYGVLGATVGQLAITITDENGDILDLNDAPVTIQLSVYYEPQA